MPAASNVMDVQAEVLVGAQQTALRTDGAELYPDHNAEKELRPVQSRVN